jgi:hypothetical protein
VVVIIGLFSLAWDGTGKLIGFMIEIFLGGKGMSC